MNFDDYKLDEDLKKALHDLGFYHPTQVQEEVIPVALCKKDIFVKAQTGSGKTAAFAIPICDSINWLENKPQALVLTPTRELAVQVRDDFTNIGRYKRIKAAVVYGRHSFATEKTELKQKNHVVVGTPGRVMDHIKRGTLNLSKLEYVVLDEADQMLDMGFIDQVEYILKELPDHIVTMMFSATMDDRVGRIAANYMKDSTHIDVSEKNVVTSDIEHDYYLTTEEEKFQLLQEVTIIENPDSCIIFCRTKDRVDNICDRLSQIGYSCDKIHGGMEQEDRLDSMKRFKRGKFRYLVATDVAARGIDISDISLVINYEVPFDQTTYVHRTGRTGRLGSCGRGITLITDGETRYLKNIEEFIGFELKLLKRPEPEEVLRLKPAFEEKLNRTPEIKTLKSDKLDCDIMKLKFYGGKKKKLRATNFVGVISNIEGVTAEDIGIITIQDTLTYIEILNGKGPIVLNTMHYTKIGGKLLKVMKIEE